MFLVPFAVILGWFLDVPMTLAFPKMAAVVLPLSVLIVIGKLTVSQFINQVEASQDESKNEYELRSK